MGEHYAAARRGTWGRHGVAAVQWAAFCVAIWAAASFSRYVSIATTDDASVVWPPLGIALACALLLGGRLAILYALVIGAWFLERGYGMGVAGLMALEQGGALFAMTVVTRRWVGSADMLDSLGKALRFYLLVPVLTLLPFAGLATLAYHVQGYFPSLGYVDIWVFHWLSEALGVVLFAAPVLYLLSSVRHLDRITAIRGTDLLVWGLFLLLLAGSFALGVSGNFNYARGIAYLFFPLLIAVALSGRILAALLMLPLAVACTVLSVYFGTWQAQTGAWNALGEALAFSGVLAIVTQLVLASTVERTGLIRFLRELNQRDQLTGEYNRRGLVQYVESGAISGEPAEYVAATLCLRNFEHSRELLSDRAGDDCERWVARRLRDRASTPGFPFALGRLDSGVFCLVMAAEQSGPVYSLLGRWLDELKGRTLTLPEGDYQLEPTIGALTFRHGESVTDVLAATWHLAREAMGSPGRPIRFGQDYQELLEGHRSELQQLERFKRALSRDDFLLFGQEIRPLNPSLGGSKVELLLRLRGDDGTPLSPAHFMPVASRFGYMADLDRWVIRNAFARLAGRAGADDQLAVFSINLSGASLSDSQLVGDIVDALEANRLDASGICFEVTETEQVEDWDCALDTLERIKALGFSVSLDDFGTGLASFDYLNRFPFDFVKIDGSFVRDLEENAHNRAVIEAVVLVARRRGIRTIAEFVETDAVAMLLDCLGVDYVQGFGIHRPEPLSELMRSQAERRSPGRSDNLRRQPP